jgi:hypothetical protein
VQTSLFALLECMPRDVNIIVVLVGQVNAIQTIIVMIHDLIDASFAKGLTVFLKDEYLLLVNWKRVCMRPEVGST